RFMREILLFGTAMSVSSGLAGLFRTWKPHETAVGVLAQYQLSDGLIQSKPRFDQCNIRKNTF
ncbi:MAG: hypothetical protein ABJN78_07930, partial [Hyphomicrobiales bacterium]